MKHKSHISRLMRAIMLGAITFSASLAYGQTFPLQKSEKLMQREQEALFNREIKTIPFESNRNLRDGKPRQVGQQPQTYPINTHPVLMSKALGESQSTTNEAAELVEKFATNTLWGSFTNANDNKVYFFTQENVPSDVNPGWQQFYKAAKFKIYNDDFEEIKSFQVSSMDTVATFTLNPAVTTKAFNNTDDWEFIILMHGFSKIGQGPAYSKDSVFIVNENSKVLRRVGSVGTAILNQFSGRYHLSLYQPLYTSIHNKYDVSIYDPKALGNPDLEMPEPLHHFERLLDNMNYSEGPIFEMVNIEGTSYYASSYYEKPFMSYDEYYNPIITKDNYFIIDFYNTSFNLVKTIRLPLIGQDKNEFSMSTLNAGFFEYQMTQHTFNDDDDIEILYGMNRYYVEDDSERVDYYLMNEKGEIIKELITGTAGTTRLMDIPGQSREYAVLIGGGDAITNITMFKMPEMEPVFNFPAMHNGELLSLAYDRIRVGDSYEYVFGLGNLEEADDTYYGVIANYNTSGENTRRFRVDLGKNVGRFSPVVQGNLMSPYAIIADDQREFVYFATQMDEGGNLINELAIANEEGTVYRWTDDKANDQMIAGAGTMYDANKSRMKYFYTSYQNFSTKEVTTRLYTLPLNQATLEGEGTEASPYLISNPADLEQIRQHPDAYYALQCDIDMSSITGLNGAGFLPIDQFKGHFDGRGHSIRNLSLMPNNSALGLFAHVIDGSISNLRMENVSFTNPKDANYGIGAIAGEMIGGQIDNCHVINDIEIEDECLNLGGLVGSLTTSAIISNSSFSGNIHSPNASNVGGIAAYMLSKAAVYNCQSQGSIYGKRNSAGIAGSINTESVVENCYSNMNIKSTSYAGGVVGSGSGAVNNNYATGKIESDFREGERWISNAGGVIADISQAMVGKSIASGNVALNSSVVMQEKASRVGNTYYEATTGANDILKNNYALATMKVGSSEETLATVDESDEITVGLDRVHGKSVTEDELTQEFFESLGWKFGNDSDNPWRMEGKYPSLWFEYRVQGVSLDQHKLTMGVGQKLTVNATVIPEKAENKKVRYESSDMRVAIVDANGEITARAKGTTVIKVISEDGKYTDQCAVTVINAIETITLDRMEQILYLYEGIELTPTINPEDADNTELIWTSSNPEVATVDKGIVRAVAAGEAEITVKAVVGDASATCKISVYPAIEDFYFETSSVNLSKENPTQQLHVTILPEEAQNVPLLWESDNETVATVDAEGIVSAVADGDAIITAMTADKLYKANCLVMVTDFSSGIEDVTNKAMIIVTDNALTISSDLNISRVMGVDIAGVTVFDNAVNGNQATVMTSALQPGAYIVKVLYENGNTTTHKIIIK